MSFEVNFLKEIEKKRHQGQNRMKSEKLKKLNWFMGRFGQSNMDSTLDFCAIPASKESNVPKLNM